MDNKMDLLAAALWRNDSYNGTADSEPLDSMNYSINLLFIGIVFIVMVSLGCTMEMSKIRVILIHLIYKVRSNYLLNVISHVI